MPQAAVAIVGAGRMGQGLGLALHRAGWQVSLVARTRHRVVAPLTLHTGARSAATLAASVVLLAVPDDGIAGLASELAAERGIGADQVVLHLSGLLDRVALRALAVDRCRTRDRSIPLQSVADPARRPRSV